MKEHRLVPDPAGLATNMCLRCGDTDIGDSDRFDCGTDWAVDSADLAAEAEEWTAEIAAWDAEMLA